MTLVDVNWRYPVSQKGSISLQLKSKDSFKRATWKGKFNAKGSIELHLLFWRPFLNFGLARVHYESHQSLCHRAYGSSPAMSCTIQRIAKGAGGKGPCQKSSKSVKKFFNTFRQFSSRAKNVKNHQKVSKVFRHFSTNFARHHFSGPCWGAPNHAPQKHYTPEKSTRITLK